MRKASSRRGEREGRQAGGRGAEKGVDEAGDGKIQDTEQPKGDTVKSKGDSAGKRGPNAAGRVGEHPRENSRASESRHASVASEFARG